MTAIVNRFRGQIESVIRGTAFNIITLPDSLPGTDVKATLCFAQLGFVESEMHTIVDAH